MKKNIILNVLVFNFIGSWFFGKVNGQASFIIPDTACVGSPINITNTTTTGTNFFWSFDSLSLGPAVAVTELPNIDNYYSVPGFIDLVFDGANYYIFNPEYDTGDLIRWDFGSNPLGNPINAVNYGPILEPTETESIYFVNDRGHWYMFSLGGEEFLRFDFGTSITDTPTVTDLGDPGDVLSWPHQLSVLKENGNWYAFAANRTSGTIARFDFGPSLTNNSPAGTTVFTNGLTPSTCNFALHKEDSTWYMMTCNLLDNSISLLDFGTAINNDSPSISGPYFSSSFDVIRGIVLLEDCGHLFGFIGNEQPSGNSCRIDFDAGITSAFSITSIGNFAGEVNFANNFLPFWYNDSLRMMVNNSRLQNVTRWDVPTTIGTQAMTSYIRTPTGIIYNNPGTYEVSMMVDEGQPHMSTECQDIIVINCSGAPTASFQSNQTTLCANDCINFNNLSTNATSWQWSFEGGNPSSSTDQNPQNICYLSAGTYSAVLIATNSTGSDTASYNSYITVFPSPSSPDITQHNDTLYCSADSLNTGYQWYSDSSIIPGATGNFLVVSQSGNYNIQVTSNNGCSTGAGINVVLGLQNYVSDNLISVFPNPASSQLVVNSLFSTDWQTVTFSITNVLGQETSPKESGVLRTPPTPLPRRGGSAVIDVSELSTGIYFLQINSERGNLTKMFVKD